MAFAPGLAMQAKQSNRGGDRFVGSEGSMGIRRTLRRYHIWLGWIIAVPMLFWTVSGLVMFARPIDEVRGTTLIAAPAPVAGSPGFIVPDTTGRPLSSLTLAGRSNGPRWVLSFADGGSRLADPASGRLLPELGAADAAREVTARYRGAAKVASVSRVSKDSPPVELRRAVDAWRVAMSDGTHFYVDAGSGDIIARRTRWWRFYDVMWGLHIMDLQGREDTNNPWIVMFAVVALISVLMAIVLLPMTSRRRRRSAPELQ